MRAATQPGSRDLLTVSTEGQSRGEIDLLTIRRNVRKGVGETVKVLLKERTNPQ